MEKFKIISVKKQSINRSIRISKANYDKLKTISLSCGISFNRVVERCIEFAIQNM